MITPGPWFWAMDKNDQYTSLRVSGSGDSIIHPQADVGDYGLSVDPWTDISEDDARAIAALPDLLQAVESAMLNPGSAEAFDLCLAASKKARGE